MKKLRFMVMMLAVLLLFLMVVTPVAAWGASHKVAAVDDYATIHNDRVCSTQMGCVYYSNFETATLDLTTVEPANVNSANLANYDTLFLFAVNPDVFSAGQKADINAFVANGGKLIIWDSEEPLAHGVWNYNWLATPFATAVPGAQAAHGILTIVEENELSSNNPASVYYINAATLGSNTDAVGDANVFTSYEPSKWCVDMTADSEIAWVPTGPTHVYTRSTPTGGIVIYSGLDWDQNSATGAGYELRKILRNEFNAASLPCTAPPQTSLTVTKDADKPTYQVGETVKFTVAVTNPSTFTAENVGLVDYPPAEVALTTTTANLGNIGPGATKTFVFEGKAIAEGCGLENSVIATGYYGADPVFTGGAIATFDIGNNCNPIPEFPSLALPIGMIMGLAFVVYSLKPVRKN